MKNVIFAICTLIFAMLSLMGCSSGSGGDNPGSDGIDFPDNLAEWTGDPKYKSPTKLPALTNQSTGLSDEWWKSSAFYHIWIKSFKDSDVGDCSKNCGDFKGIEDSLGYIQDELGCDAIWLSPFWDCWYKGSTNAASAASNMHGYDVNDFYAVNKYFGTGDATAESAEAELDSLIAACHKRGMKIIFDFVPNHTSHENKWFTDSAAGQNGKSDWYVWNSTSLGWKNTWGADAWHQKNGKYYYAAFADTQPDLNYRNYEVREEMKNVVRYWLNKGFDGLRIDAVRYLVETADSLTDTDETHDWFAELREVIDEYDAPKFMACEAWITGNRTALNKYFGTSEKPEFNMVLDFDQGEPIIASVYVQGTEVYRDNKFAFDLTKRIFANPGEGKSYGTFLGNHDEYANRLGDWYGAGTNERTILATALSLLRPTVPFIYYGNEIAQKSGSQSGDFRLRQPFDWSAAQFQSGTDDSLLFVNKTLLALRNREDYADVFANGAVEVLNCDMIYSGTKDPWKGAFAYTITTGAQTLLVVANLTESAQSSLWFTKPASLDLSSYSLIVGNTDTANGIYTETYTNGTTDLLFHNFTPYEIRVYDMTSGGKTCALDVWDFALTTMYLRGTMNGWNSTKMTYNSGTNAFTATVSLTAGTAYEFKFDELGDWMHSFGPTSAATAQVTLATEYATSDLPGLDVNFSFTPSADGTYIFTFHRDTHKITVTQ